MKLKILLSFLLFGYLLSPFNGCSQMFIGGGYTETYINGSAFNDVKGLSIDLQKEISISESNKWKIIPMAHIGFLTTRIEQEFSPAYTTTVSITPAISYRALKFGFLEVDAFGGPFASYILGLEGGDSGIFESNKRSFLRGGLALGLSTTLKITEKFDIKFVPYSIQFGNNGFRNGLMSLYFKI